MVDRELFANVWNRNERELRSFFGLMAQFPHKNFDLLAPQIEELEHAQDHIEWWLGFDHPRQAASRHWSGMV
ncbi:MAG TPA: hypothetical protein VFG04_30800 [Planctomycetaceae bacterium]|jgi:hypothetical protein|nr:hypothetical protein [Planctomycetaceae bacterium]